MDLFVRHLGRSLNRTNENQKKNEIKNDFIETQ